MGMDQHRAQIAAEWIDTITGEIFRARVALADRAHILDLRARVRTRHLLSHQRTEWQQRMHTVLYHHGFPQRRNLLSLGSREWLSSLTLRAAAREQLEIALHVIGGIDLRLVPFDHELHAIARRQP
jgi:hypothetical protein